MRDDRKYRKPEPEAQRRIENGVQLRESRAPDALEETHQPHVADGPRTQCGREKVAHRPENTAANWKREHAAKGRYQDGREEQPGCYRCGGRCGWGESGVPADLRYRRRFPGAAAAQPVQMHHGEESKDRRYSRCKHRFSEIVANWGRGTAPVNGRIRQIETDGAMGPGSSPAGGVWTGGAWERIGEES